MIPFGLWALGTICVAGYIMTTINRGQAAARRWNVAAALLFIACVPVDARARIWPDVYIAAFAAVSVGLWWLFERRRARQRDKEAR